MKDLIERLKAAAEGSRELDADIAKAVGAEHGPYERVHLESRSIEIHDEIAPHYTTRPHDFTAAMSLVPPGFWLVIETGTQKHAPSWEWPVVEIGSQETGGSIWKGQARTLALALCTAALKAIENGEG